MKTSFDVVRISIRVEHSILVHVKAHRRRIDGKLVKVKAHYRRLKGV